MTIPSIHDPLDHAATIRVAVNAAAREARELAGEYDLIDDNAQTVGHVRGRVLDDAGQGTPLTVLRALAAEHGITVPAQPARLADDGEAGLLTIRRWSLD